MSDYSNVGTVRPAPYHSVRLAVFIGRFQPLHNGHVAVIERALSTSDTLLILIGSAGQARDTYNPFTFEERRDMILLTLPPEDRKRVLIKPLPDQPYNDAAWTKSVQIRVHEALEHFTLSDVAQVALIGHSKDHTSFYLKMFPQWASIEVPNYRGLSATPIRARFFTRNGSSPDIDPSLHPAPVTEFLKQFYDTDTHVDIVEEFDYIQRYKKPYDSLPYPPIFSTVDACVVQSGHVLLIRRRSRPGKNLWALPGGFLNANEWIRDAVIRELKEETRIRIPEAVLRGSIVAEKVFDSPNRSQRGRIITHAFLFKLKDEVELPKVKGADDAVEARWFPIADIKPEICFEDHAHLISNLISYL